MGCKGKMEADFLWVRSGISSPHPPSQRKQQLWRVGDLGVYKKEIACGKVRKARKQGFQLREEWVDSQMKLCWAPAILSIPFYFHRKHSLQTSRPRIQLEPQLA